MTLIDRSPLDPIAFAAMKESQGAPARARELRQLYSDRRGDGPCHGRVIFLKGNPDVMNARVYERHKEGSSASHYRKLQAQFTSLWALAAGGLRVLDTVDLTLTDVVRAVSESSTSKTTVRRTCAASSNRWIRKDCLVSRTGPKPLLYLASPLFTPSERAFNVHIDALLHRHFKTFLPQRDGHLIPGAHLTARSYQEMSRKVFSADVRAIAQADVLLAILDGRTIDEGVAFELGLAFALGKTTVGFRSDARVLLPWGSIPWCRVRCRRASAAKTNFGSGSCGTSPSENIALGMVDGELASGNRRRFRRDSNRPKGRWFKSSPRNPDNEGLADAGAANPFVYPDFTQESVQHAPDGAGRRRDRES